MNTLRKILPVLLLVLIYGCGSSDESGTDTNNNSNGGTTGTLKGAVSLLDTTGLIASDKSGVKVELLGTSFSAVSDADGIWSIPNLPSRTYTLCYSKPGYDTIKSQFAFLGGETVWIRNTVSPVVLFHTPVFTSTLDAFILPIDSYIDSVGQEHGTIGTIAGHLSENAPAKTYLGAMILLGKNPVPDINDSKTFDTMFASNSGIFIWKYSPSDAINATTVLRSTAKQWHFFPTGETIYCRIFPFTTTMAWDPTIGYGAKSPSYYINPEDQRIVYYGVGQGSNVLSVVMK
ncbi:MAG TPA: hypothetical protein VFO76_02495 [Candidatus Kapabacteria bacterium]|nr:hypothetical protein [Candidatus Kapabacteria bacterium]